MSHPAQEFTQLIEDIEIFEYFEKNYVTNDQGLFLINYPPSFTIPLVSKSYEGLFDQVMTVADQMRQEIASNRLTEQLQKVVDELKE